MVLQTYTEKFAKTDFKKLRGVAVLGQSTLIAGLATRTRKKCLPQRLVFRKVLGGEGYSVGHGTDRMVRVEKDVTYCGMTFDAWRKAAQKAGRRFQLFEDLEETIMRE